jgi:hypothetical protein
VFRRRKADPTSETDELEAEPLESAESSDEPTAALEVSFDRSNGPWDVSDIPDTDELTRLDLGSLQVAAYEGMELRLDIDEATSVVQAATIVVEGSSMQLTVFAAPRVEGIWQDIRREITASIGSSGGVVDEVTGPMGKELLATLPAEGPDGKPALMPVRFVGIDGPRWFLRGLITGPAAREAAPAAPLEAVLLATVVVRGHDPMAPGDPLPLNIPTDIPAGLAPGNPPEDLTAESEDLTAESEETPPTRRSLPPPRRGPEITEIR